jgi:hypothetical protein
MSKKDKNFIQKREEKGLEEFRVWLRANKSLRDQIARELEAEEC